MGETKRKEAVINRTITANSKQQKLNLKYILMKQYAMQSDECTDEIKNYFFLWNEKELMLKFKQLMNTFLRKIKSSERLRYWGRQSIVRTKPKWHTMNKGGVQMQFCFSFEKSSEFFAEEVEADLCHQW